MTPAHTEQPTFEALVQRLSRTSVDHSEVYAAVAWDDPDLAVDLNDPRWELNPANDPLADTDWYKSQLPARRFGIGLYRTALHMKVGIEFEAVLQIGLLRLAATLPNGSSLFRYLYHEITEEAQHSMMFQEFVNRSGQDVQGFPDEFAIANESLIELATSNPVLFFLVVLSGERPIDHLQRQTLKLPAERCHPLIEQICRIHIREESRHIALAKDYVRHHVGRTTGRDGKVLRYQAPRLVAHVVRRMLVPTKGFQDAFDIPDEVMAEAYQGVAINRIQRAATSDIVGLCLETGVITDRLRPMWEHEGLLGSGSA